MVYNNFKALAKSLGKYILPSEVVSEYRSQIQDIDESVLIITLDSCRYDAFIEAYENQLPAKNVRKAYSPCNWTLPSHDSIVRGFIPFGEFVHPFEDFDYRNGVPLTIQHKYSFGSTAIPYLSSSEHLRNNFHTYFDDYYCSEDAGSTEEVFEKAAEYIKNGDNFFGLINLGETHSPYKNFDEKTTEGIVQDLKAGKVSYETLYDWQVESARKLIQDISDFREHIPKGTLVVVTADHGELFGEGDAFGHNPHMEAIFHEKLYEVPLIYWTES